MGLLDSLGLQPKGAPGVPPAAGSPAQALTGADFPADAKRRKAADADALRKGREQAGAKDEKPGAGPPTDPLDAKIEELIGDPEKRIKALAKWNVPQFSDTYKDDTPAIRFLADLKSGTEQADKYVKYIQQVAEYAEKVGDLGAFERIKPAASGLKKISGRISSGLGTVVGAVDKAQKIAKWCVALDGFAQASLDMNAKDRESVKHWVKSMQGLWNATVPFLEWLHSKAVTAALGGSEVAGAAGATMAIVGAELFIGLKALEAGVHNVDAYFTRMDERMREIEGGAPVPKAQPPQSPGEWSTREEIATHFKQREDDELRAKIARARNAKQAQDDEAAAKTQEKFDTDVFPEKYMPHRRKIKDYIYAALRKARGDPKSKPALWWDCLVPDDTPVEMPDDTAGPSDDGVTLDDRDEFDIEKRKESPIDIEDARTEVRQFLELSSPCPAFDAVHSFELKKYLAGAK